MTPRDMKRHYLTMLLVGFTASNIANPVRAAEKLEPGKDRIDTPAIGSGLCVHNLFQSNMVLQRDKPIRVWGRAADPAFIHLKAFDLRPHQEKLVITEAGIVRLGELLAQSYLAPK